MELAILGPLAVSDHGRAVELAGARPRALLALLALHPGQVLAADRLVDGLWGGMPPAHAGHAERARWLHLDSLTPAGHSGDRRVVAMALQGLAGAAALAGEAERAATLLGAAERQRGDDAPVSLRGPGEYERTAAAALARLGATRFDQARKRGAALSLDQALRYAGEVEGGAARR